MSFTSLLRHGGFSWRHHEQFGLGYLTSTKWQADGSKDFIKGKRLRMEGDTGGWRNMEGRMADVCG